MDKVAVEFVGTFFWTLAVLGALTQASPLGALAVGGMVAVIVEAGRPTSGAHFNPAVSLAWLLRGRLAGTDVPSYLGAQLAGASLASLLGVWLFRATAAPGPGWEGRQLITAVVVEALFTFLLVHVALTVRSGLAVGATVAVAILLVGTISGAILNPAVALCATFAQQSPWGNFLAYAVAQLTGGLLAGFAARWDTFGSLVEPKESS